MHSVVYMTDLTVNFESVLLYDNFQPPVGIEFPFSGVKRPERDADYSASSVAVKNAQSYHSTPHPHTCFVKRQKHFNLSPFVIISIVTCRYSYETSAMEQVPHSVGDGGTLPRSD